MPELAAWRKMRGIICRGQRCTRVFAGDMRFATGNFAAAKRLREQGVWSRVEQLLIFIMAAAIRGLPFVDWFTVWLAFDDLLIGLGFCGAVTGDEMKAVSSNVIGSRTVVSPTIHTNGVNSKYIGIAIAALVPAVFWPALIGQLMTLSGLAVSSVTLLGLGVAIAVFLSMVCSALLLRN